MQRLGSHENSLGIYSLDAITGEVDVLRPADHGSLPAALARSWAESLLLDAEALPQFGATAQFERLPLDVRKRDGLLLLLLEGDPDRSVSSFAAANAGGQAQMVSLASSDTALVIGIEDQLVAAGISDADHNDLIVRISNAVVPLC